MSSTLNSKPVVLIIGGGLAGMTALVDVRKYNKEAEVVLVEPNDFFEILWGAYRSPFDEANAKASLFSLKDVCEQHNVTHKKVHATKLEETEALLSEGSKLAFDVAIVTVGAKTKWDGLARGFEDNGNDGGLVGAELAGDVAYHSKKNESKVTLIHSGPFLCPDTDEQAGKMIQGQLKKSGVQVILNTRAEKKSEGAFKCGDEEVKADRVIMTVGLQPNNSFVKEDSCDEKGWVDADINLRVKGYNGRVFAVGDYCNAMPNNGKDIMLNSAIFGNSMRESLKALDESSALSDLSLKDMAVGPAMAVCTTSTGPKSGVIHSAFFNTSYVFPWINNMTMFFISVRLNLGLQPAKLD